MPNKKHYKKSGVFRTPEELQECFATVRIIIHSHVYENNPQYEALIGSLIGTLMQEYHEFRKIGIEPIEFFSTEEDEVSRRNIMAIMEDIKNKIELTQKLKGVNGGKEDESKS